MDQLDKVFGERLIAQVRERYVYISNISKASELLNIPGRKSLELMGRAWYSHDSSSLG